MKIVRFYFTYRDEDGNPLSYNTPDEAIKDFNKRGYGMHNFTIMVLFDNESHAYIPLSMFNYLTDNWKVLNGE
jgi:hypothetical protein